MERRVKITPATGKRRHAVPDEAVELIGAHRGHGRLLLTGDDSIGVAELAMTAMNRGWQVAFPGGAGDLDRWHPESYSVRVRVDHDAWSCTRGLLAARTGEWDVAMSTSGTTGTPKTYAFTAEQIDDVCRRYAELYQLNPDAHIVTALPAAHNFAFVAGLLTASGVGCTMVFGRDHSDILRWLRERRGGSRVLVLASPILLETRGLEDLGGENLLVDSGAAPVTRPYVQHLRSRGIDLREGYGTTETLSLTHFDVDPEPASAGTVGRVLRGIEHRLDTERVISVRSPLRGRPLSVAGTEAELQEAATADSWIQTGDLGAVDDNGRLRLVGRLGDHRIGGVWPRDILDALGEVLGARTAAVSTGPDWVNVTVTSALAGEERARIEHLVVDLTGLPHANVFLPNSPTALTYSLKLPRSTAPQLEG